jgi:hypothetical protein
VSTAHPTGGNMATQQPENKPSIFQQTVELPVLPEHGKKALKLLLQQPKQIGLITSAELPPGGYPAYILQEDGQYRIVRRNVYYGHDPSDYPLGAEKIERETCQIPVLTMYEALSQIPEWGHVVIEGTALYRYESRQWGPEGYTPNKDTTEEDKMTLVIALSFTSEHQSVILSVYRGAPLEDDGNLYARIWRESKTSKMQKEK